MVGGKCECQGGMSLYRQLQDEQYGGAEDDGEEFGDDD
jgi:hypothetical protein